jgi:transcription-repair coupling factor (superfamily II helicase)
VVKIKAGAESQVDEVMAKLRRVAYDADTPLVNTGEILERPAVADVFRLSSDGSE